MVGTGWNWLEMAVNGLKLLKMAGIVINGWTSLEMTGAGCICQEMVVNGWIWLERLKRLNMDGSGWIW